KFLISAGTGIGTGFVCYTFGVSFPIFWGIFAFAINFVQMVGSFIAIIMCSIFAFVELEIGTSLLYFVLSVTGVQVIFGSILEPIFMGKSFSINIIVVLVMLMFWGYVWGITGMIMSIPLTVFAKIILEQFEKTKRIARLME
ncbi:MAG: AI-2E family transporter, partial [Crocinitomicaceae bacterium]